MNDEFHHLLSSIELFTNLLVNYQPRFTHSRNLAYVDIITALQDLIDKLVNLFPLHEDSIRHIQRKIFAVELVVLDVSATAGNFSSHSYDSVKKSRTYYSTW